MKKIGISCGKRLLAGILACAMALTLLPTMPVKAEETYAEVMPYELDTIRQEMLDSEEAKTIEKETITFPYSGTGVYMGQELIYHLFRQGDTTAARTVQVSTLDLTAGYGEDYEIVVDGKTVKGKANRILDGEGVVYDVFLGENVLQQETDSQDTEAGTEADEDAKAAVTAEEKEQWLAQASSTFEVNFLPGEDMKEIRIRAKVPKEAVGNKLLTLAILEGGADWEQGACISSSVTLYETREVEEPEVTIQTDSEEVVDGYVTVLVERKGNTAGYTSYTLEAEDGSAVCGQDYIFKSAQLTFTPGVSKQRIHIPLTASEEAAEKEFTLKIGESEETVTYTSTARGAAFKEERGLIHIPMSEFEKSSSTIGDFDFGPANDDGTRYQLSFDTGFGDGSNRSASIKTKEMYDFTGVDGLKMSASYEVGTVIGDHLDVYAAAVDLCHNKSSLSQIETRGWGRRIDTVSLTGQQLIHVDIQCGGKSYLYMTAEQHSSLGHIGYNLYNEEFDGGDEGHVALMLTKYAVQAMAPLTLNGNVVAGNVTLELLSQGNPAGTRLDAYRDESFLIKYDLLEEAAHFSGYQILDGANKVVYTKYTDSPIFCLDADIIQKCSAGISDKTFRIRPMFTADTAEVEILHQDFAAMGMDASVLTVEIDEANRKAVYKEGAEVITTVSWNTSMFTKGTTLQFSVQENPAYKGDYHFGAFQVVSGEEDQLTNENPIYYTDPNWSMVIESHHYQITPIVTNKNARFLLKVKGATHGSFVGEPEGNPNDGYEMAAFDGKYQCNDIAVFWAKPDQGYRAKWSYRDVATNQTRVFYGNTFYYRLQFPALLTDNHVTLEFVKANEQQEYQVIAEVYMQGGDILHQPDPDTAEYTPMKSGTVSMEGVSKEVAEDGSAGVFTVMGAADEVHTALVLANNRYYIEEVNLADASAGSLREKMELSYYYEGPRITYVQYYDMDSRVQNGDTIYIQNETESVVIGATVQEAGSEVTDVIYRLKDADGNTKQEAIAERNGSEYIWAVPIGMVASQGDQIWVELVYREEDSNGGLIKQISYGEVNTGYSIVVAEFDEASYIPDTEHPDEVPAPLIGNMFFSLSMKGVKPIFTTSRSGNITYLTLGLSFGGARNMTTKKWGLPSWSTAKTLRQSAGVFISPEAKENDKIAAKQVLKKHSLMINLTGSAQLALYNAQNEETHQYELLCVGAYLSVGFSAAYTFTLPFTVSGIPLYVCTTITGSFGDTVQLMPATGLEYVDVRMMHDPSKSTYKPENDMKLTLALNLAMGVGVNGVISVSGGGTGTLGLQWIDFDRGKGTLSLSGECRAEFLIVGKTFTIASCDTTLFDTSGIQATSELSGDMTEQMLATRLGDLKLDTQQMQELAAASQSLDTEALAEGGDFIRNAYQFTKPRMILLDDHKYLIVATVNEKFVDGGTSHAAGDHNILAYAIYDADTQTWATAPERAVGEGTAYDTKVFRSLEPLGDVGRSVNFHPIITELGDGKYLVAWNSIPLGNQKELDLSNLRSVIKAAIYDSKDHSLTYKSLVTTDDQDHLLSSVVVDALYDAGQEQAILLYRTMNMQGLTKDSTLRDYERTGGSLNVTSLDVSDSGLGDKDSTFTDSLTLATGGGDTFIKNADLGLVDGTPVCTWHETTGSQASFLAEAEADSRNHIYLTGLRESDSSVLRTGSKIEVGEQENTTYQAMPQIVSWGRGDAAKSLLMWKQNGRMAAVDAKALLASGKARNTVPQTPEEVNVLMSPMNDTLAGEMGDFQLIRGRNEQLYAIWTEGTGSSSRVMMSALGEQEVDGHCFGVWGKGSEVYESQEGYYIQSISPVIAADGSLQVLFRETNLKEAQDSKVVFQRIDLSPKAVAASYREYSEGTTFTQQELAVVNNDTDLDVSNLFPSPGETVLIRGKVRNEGVELLRAGTVPLLDGEGNTVATAFYPDLAAGEEAVVEFTYVMPTAEDDREVSLKLGLADAEDSHRASDRRGVTLRSGASSELDITSLSYEQLNYLDEGEGGTYRFKVTAGIRNVGNSPSPETTFVLSHLKETSPGNDYRIEETVLGQCQVPELDPEQSEIVSFEMEIASSMITGKELKLLSVAAAVYENYKTKRQVMTAGTEDYLQAQSIPEAQTLSCERTKQVGIGQKLNLLAVITPLVAQKYVNLSYRSSDAGIASVDANGIVTGVEKGTCTITVTTDNGLSSEVTVKVTEEAALEKPGEGIEPEEEDKKPFGPSADTGDISSGMAAIPVILSAMAAFLILMAVRRRYKKR